MDIVATGMVCAVGLSSASACAAIRARVAGFEELAYRDNRGEPIVGAAVPGLAPEIKRDDRLVKLLGLALADLLGPPGRIPTARVPLFVGLAEPGRPGGGADLAGSVVGCVEETLGVRFHPRRSAALARGNTAGFEALRLAREALADPGIPACLVAGVDSFLNAPSLLWLDLADRLKTGANPDGVIPGEGAACVLVVRPEPTPREGCVARVVGLGFAEEPAPVLGDDPMLGLGMAEAGRAALAEAGLPLHAVDYRLSDLAGESYSFPEQALTVARLMRERRDCLPVWHAAETIGETGAAAGLVQLVLASTAFRKRYAPGPRAIGFTAAVPGARAAVVLERQLAGPSGGTIAP